MTFCYCGHWLSKSRTVELNHSLERSHLKAKEMCDYQTGPINSLNNPLSLLCTPILLMLGPLLPSHPTWHSEQQSEFQKYTAESGPWKMKQPPHTTEQHV